MRDPEEMLRSLPPESPPPEVVLAAVRVFRLRAIAAVGLACALVMSAFILNNKINEDSRLQERIGEIRYTSGGTMTVGEFRELDGLEVVLWEVVIDEDSSYVHVLGWDERGRDFNLAISDAEADGSPVSLGSIESYGGGREPTHADLWQEIRIPSSAEKLTFDVDVRGYREGPTGSIPFEIGL